GHVHEARGAVLTEHAALGRILAAPEVAVVVGEGAEVVVGLGAAVTGARLDAVDAAAGRQPGVAVVGGTAEKRQLCRGHDRVAAGDRVALQRAGTGHRRTAAAVALHAVAHAGAGVPGVVQGLLLQVGEQEHQAIEVINPGVAVVLRLPRVAAPAVTLAARR